VGGGYFFLRGEKQESAPMVVERGPQKVSVMSVAEQAVSLKRILPGRVSPVRQSQVRPQVDGIIVQRLFEEGSQVEEGQQLYQIDDTRYKAALASAMADLMGSQAALKTLEARLGRYNELMDMNAVSRQEYDDATADLDSAKAAIAIAKANVDLARINMEYTKVYAPISGQIGRSMVTEGALVTANQSAYLAVITQLDPVYVDMQQSGNEMAGLRRLLQDKGTVPVSLMINEAQEEAYPHQGQLKFFEVMIDESAGSVPLRAVIPNPETMLLPGLFVRATLELGTQNALLVPQRAATRSSDGSLSVWVVDQNNQVSVRPITAQEAYQDQWVVTKGLQPGESIVVEGTQKIGPGAMVDPVPWTEENSKPPSTEKTP